MVKIGHEHLKGWDGLVDQMLLELREIDPDIKIVQIKEKFGLLRVYFDTLSGRYNELEAIIDKYEALSGQTCESCGTTENVTREGAYWVKTLCKECRVKELKEAG